MLHHSTPWSQLPWESALPIGKTMISLYDDNDNSFKTSPSPNFWLSPELKVHCSRTEEIT